MSALFLTQVSRRFALALALVVATAGSAWSQQVTNETLIGDAVADADSPKYSDIERAITRFANNDVISAKSLLESAKRADDKLPPVDMMMAKLYLLSNNTAAYLISLEEVLRNEPGDPEPYLLLADQAIGSNQAVQASALYDKAIEQLKTYDKNGRRKQKFIERAYSGRAQVYQRWGNWAAAEADLTALIQANPEDAGAYSRLGVVQFQLGKENEGYKSFVKAKELNKDMPVPYVAAANMYQQLKDKDPKALDKARQAYERAYSENKNDRITVIAYSEWLIRQNKLDQALAVLNDGAKALPDVFEIALLRAVAFEMLDKPAEAEAEYNRALAISPGNRDAQNQLALLLINQDSDEAKRRAETLARINAKLYDSSPDVHITLAWILKQVNKGAEANQAYQKGVRLGQLSGDSTLLVAKLLQAQGQEDTAKKILQNALEQEKGIFVNRAEAEALLETLK
jgi:Tfp pilus assembly protein PilF